MIRGQFQMTPAVFSVIIGLLNIPKILSCRNKSQASGARRASLGGLIYLSVFFSVHYGMFCFGHYAFLQTIYPGLPDASSMVDVMTGPLLFWSLLGLLASHLVSMIVNFYGKGEYKTRSPNTQMFMPYPRIVVLHIVIIIGGGFAVATGQGTVTLLLLVLIKIVFDLAAHLVEHSEKENLIAPSVN